MNRLVACIFTLSFAFGWTPSASSAETSPELLQGLLSVGEAAPPLDIEYWFGDPARPQSITFEPGHVYVIEFWATWCKPCVAGMPHLAKLQTKYADQNVTVIGVSDEESDIVEEFLNGAVPGLKNNESTTYRELTSQYRLASDPDLSTFDDYMTASKQDGIPNAFVVGKTGQLEWVGHPTDLDDVLASVLNDTWDSAAFAKAFAGQQLYSVMLEKFYEAAYSGDLETAKAVLKEVRNLSDLPDRTELVSMFERDLKFHAVIEKMEADPEAAADMYRGLLAESKGHPREIFFAASDLVDLELEDEVSIHDSLYRVAAAACEAELDNAGVDEGVLLNMIGTLYKLTDDAGQAKSFYERAVKYAQANGKTNLDWFQEDLDALSAE